MSASRRMLWRRNRGRVSLIAAVAAPPPPASDVEFVSVGAVSSVASGSGSPGLPGSLAADDVLICVAAMRGTDVPTMDVAWTLGGTVESVADTQPYAMWLLNGSGADAMGDPEDLTITGATGQAVGNGNGYNFPTTALGGVVFDETSKLYTSFNGQAVHAETWGFKVNAFGGNGFRYLGGISSVSNGALLGMTAVHDDGALEWQLNHGSPSIRAKTAAGAVTAGTGAEYELTVIVDMDQPVLADRIRFLLSTDGSAPVELETVEWGDNPEGGPLSIVDYGDDWIMKVAGRGDADGGGSGRPLDCQVNAVIRWAFAPTDAQVTAWHAALYANNDASPITAATSLAWWWHRFTGVAPDLTVTRASSECMVSSIIAYRNVFSGGSPIDAMSEWFDAGGASSVDIEMGDPALSTVNADSMAVFLSAEAGNSAVATPTGGSVTWVERLDSGTSLGSDVRLAVADGLRLGSGTVDAVTTAASSGRHVGMGLALRKAS